MRMNRGCRYCIAGLLVGLALSVMVSAGPGDNPKEWIGFWQKNYAELKPADDPRAAP